MALAQNIDLDLPSDGSKTALNYLVHSTSTFLRSALLTFLNRTLAHTVSLISLFLRLISWRQVLNNSSGRQARISSFHLASPEIRGAPIKHPDRR